MTKPATRQHPHCVFADPVTFHLERVTARLTQRQAADYLGVTPRTMRNWETGRTRIPYPAFKLIRMRAGGIVHAPGWDGWRFGRGGALFSPDGRSFQPWELYHLRLVFSMSRYFQQAHLAKRQPLVAENVSGGAA